MAASSVKQKSPKGTVQVKVSHDRLQLVFRYGGKRHYLSLGLPDSKINRKAAVAKAKLIESDMAFDRFDPTLEKYRPKRPEEETPAVGVTITPKLSLMNLWKQYTDFKRPSLSPSTIGKDYAKITSCLENHLPTQALEDAVLIRDWLMENRTVNGAKRTLTQLSACCDWATKSGLIHENPFRGMAKDIKAPKAESDEGDVDPFTLEERDRIIEAFRNNRFFGYYAPLIEFLFLTGCRPSEAVALLWKHISEDGRVITFEQAVVRGERTLEVKPYLKTQKRRVFPANAKVSALLCGLRTTTVKPEDKVFPSPRGTWIDTHNLSGRGWKTILEELDEIEYRNLYQTRHTFATLAIQHGMGVKDLSKVIGNSPRMIFKHYLGGSRQIEVPEF